MANLQKRATKAVAMTKASPPEPKLESIRFSVDAALLRELGERLVGQPHIALAELIKNSYDADAHHSEIRFGDDEIVVTDDGDGMSTAAFRDFWMRVGSPHKQEIGETPLGR